MVLFKDLFQKTDNAFISNSLLTNLRAYFSLDEFSGDRHDALGNDHFTGSLSSTPGIIGSGVQFDGSGNLTANDPQNDIWNLFQADFTLSFWLEIDDRQVTQTIISKYDTSAPNNSYQIGIRYISEQTNYIEIWLDNRVDLAEQMTFELAIASGVMHHWLIVHDRGNERVTIYIDNQEIGQQNYSLNLSNAFTTQAVYLGLTQGSGWGSPLAGKLDELGIWNRKLNDNERSLLFNNGDGFAQPLFRTDNVTIPLSNSSNPTLTVTDGTTSVDRVDLINISGATISNDGNGDITLTITASGGAQTATEIRDLLQGLTDPDQLKGGAIANFRDINNAPTDDFAPIYDLATDKILWQYVNRGIGAGAILLPLSQSLFTGADGTAIATYTPEVGSATFADVKILTTAGTPDNQLLSDQLRVNTPNTGAVVDLGVSNTVIKTDWVYSQGDNGAIILRYESDGNMMLVDLTGTAIALKSVETDAVTTIASETFSFNAGTTYLIEVQVVGLDYKILVDDAIVVDNVASALFLTATNFGIGRLA